MTMTSAERRRNRMSMVAVAVPAVLFLVFVIGLFGLHHRNTQVRWTAVGHTCPSLDPMVATLLRLKPGPLPPGDDDEVSADRSRCRYAGVDDETSGTRPELTVTVIVYAGEITHSGHDLARQSVTDYPPRGFRALGPQPEDGRFGLHGGALDLQLVEDNAAVRVAYVSTGAGAVLRAPLQAVANQAIAGLG